MLVHRGLGGRLRPEPDSAESLVTCAGCPGSAGLVGVRYKEGWGVQTGTVLAQTWHGSLDQTSLNHGGWKDGSSPSRRAGVRD